MKHTRNTYHYQFRKCKRAEEKIKRDKLQAACLGEGGNIFKEIKSLRKSGTEVATSIDGVTQDIPEHFGRIYSELYNSANDGEKLAEVYVRANAEVNESSQDVVSKITQDIIKSACKKLKPGKSDPILF